MFSPTVSDPLTCSPGRFRGLNPSYCATSLSERSLNAALSASVHHSLRLPFSSYSDPWSSKPCPISWPMTAPMPP